MSWQELHKPWHDTSVDYCDVCGNLLIHNYWEFKADGKAMRACREDDERLWTRLESFRASYPPVIVGSPITRQSTDAGLPATKERRS
jgi:hypothetical protein